MIVGPAGWGPRAGGARGGRPRRLHRRRPDAVLAELYRRARAFAYVPLTEGYGLPPLEAMRAGIPTVVSDEVPSVHDLGATEPAPARIVDPLDVDDIAGGLAAVLTDDGLRADLARRGAAHASAAHLARRRPRPHRTLAVAAVTDEPPRPLARRLGRPGAAGRRRATTPWRWPAAWPGATDVGLTLVARRGDEQRWRDLAGGAAVRGAVPVSRPGRLVFEQVRLGSVLRSRRRARSTTDRTTRCRPGRRCPAP